MGPFHIDQELYILTKHSQFSYWDSFIVLKIKPKFCNQFFVLFKFFVQVAIMKLQECKSKQFQAHNLYKRKSTMNQWSSFGLIEESMELRGCHTFATKIYWLIQFLEYLRTFKISEGSDQNWSCPGSALLAVSVNTTETVLVSISWYLEV